MSLDSGSALGRARSVIGFLVYPQGRCLANVYQWFGSPASKGPGAGRFATAFDAWTYAADKRSGDWNPPAGVPVYFGISPNRTDANKRAGDVGISIGGGQGIFTDSSGARVGVMSLAARAIQTQRPYLGWCGDFVGHPVSAAGSVPASSGATPIPTSKPAAEKVAVAIPAQEEHMYRYAVIDPKGKTLAYVKVTQVRHDIISEAEMRLEYAASGLNFANLPRVAQDVDSYLTSQVEVEKAYLRAAVK